MSHADLRGGRWMKRSNSFRWLTLLGESWNIRIGLANIVLPRRSLMNQGPRPLPAQKNVIPEFSLRPSRRVP